MKKILVSLISEQTIPNILVAAHCRPDEHWLISTRQMEKLDKAGCIEKTLDLTGVVCPSKKIIVDQDSLSNCREGMVRLMEEAGYEAEYTVNITCGNKVMAIAAYEAFRDSGQKVIVGYVPIGTNEFMRIFPERRPLTHPIEKRLTVEEYFCAYGFRITNRKRLKEAVNHALSRRRLSEWILNNHERLKGVLGFMYKHASDGRNKKHWQFSARFERTPSVAERKLLDELGFIVRNDGVVCKDLVKHEVAYITGGWLEEHVFCVVNDLAEQGVLDDAMVGVAIESMGGVQNELDVAFTKDNVFYHIECKTGGGDDMCDIIRGEIYKKGALSTLLGKGERRAYICTTLASEDRLKALKTRAYDYGIEVLTVKDTRHLGSLLRRRFAEKDAEGRRG